MESQEKANSFRTTPYGAFAFMVCMRFCFTYIVAIFFDTLVFGAQLSVGEKLMVIPIGATVCFLLVSFLGTGLSLKTGYGLRGWSNIRVDTEPKIVMAVLCLPVFLVWLLCWPVLKVIAALRKGDVR